MIEIEHVELLRMARDLHDLPRGMGRFQEYLTTILNDARDNPRYPPLVAMNPMGREHVAARLDELMALDAEAIAADAAREVARHFPNLDGDYKHGLVVVDDLHGGWTNRFTVDAGMRFGDGSAMLKRGWLSTMLWVSETPTAESVRRAVLASVFRSFYRFGQDAPRTLRQMLAQEGAVGRFAGLTPTLDADDLDYSREVLASYLDSDDWAVCMAALFGDQAAISLGYPPLGLSASAGLDVSLADEQFAV